MDDIVACSFHERSCIFLIIFNTFSLINKMLFIILSYCTVNQIREISCFFKFI